MSKEPGDKNLSFFTGGFFSAFVARGGDVGVIFFDWIECHDISLMGNNLSTYAFEIGEKYTYFIYHHYKFIENDKIVEGTLFNGTDGSLVPYDYHVEKCGVDSFKKLEHGLIHTCWPGHGEDIENEDDDLVEEDIVEEDETPYLNGNNEVVKIFNQKCVVCLERDSVYAFRQCGHQCICEQCYENKEDIDILKCVLCRT